MERANPFCPSDFAWQLPPMQPARVRMGRTSFSKETVAGSAARSGETPDKTTKIDTTLFIRRSKGVRLRFGLRISSFGFRRRRIEGLHELALVVPDAEAPVLPAGVYPEALAVGGEGEKRRPGSVEGSLLRPGGALLALVLLQ